MPRKIRTLAEEENYVSLNLPSIERRSLMEAGMRSKTTRFEMLVVGVFLLGLLMIAGYLLGPALARMIAHLPDLVVNTGH